MSSLPGIGNICYNGFCFKGPRVSSSLAVRPERDEAGRTVIADVYTLDVTAYVTHDAEGRLGWTTGTPLDARLPIEDIQARLTQDGGVLNFNGLGRGDFEINTSDTNKDIAWGPKTQLITFRPVGGANCIEVKWSVEFATKRCLFGITGNVGAIKSFNYGVDYSISRGLTTRTIAGHIEIVLHRLQPGARGIPDTVDSYRSFVKAAVPLGFRREQQDWKVHPNKSRLDFTFRDTELPGDNAFPEGVVDIEVTHRVRNEIGNKRAMTSRNIVSGHVETAKPFPPQFGWERVLLIIRERVALARQQAAGGVLIDYAEITEHLFSRRVEFSVQWRRLMSGFDKMLVNNAMFSGTPSTNEVAWHGSMQETAWHPRGSARMVHQARSDRIIDVCNQAPGIQIIDGIEFDRRTADAGSLSNQCPPRRRSYLLYLSRVDIEGETTIIENHPMPDSSQPPQLESVEIDGQSIPLPESPGFVNPRQGKRVEVQQEGELEITVVLRGHAARVCYMPELPQIVNKSGMVQEIIREKTKDSHAVIADYGGGVQVFARRWDIRYRVTFENASQMRELLERINELVETPDDPDGGKLNAGD